MESLLGDLDQLNEEDIHEILKYIKNKQKLYTVCQRFYQICSTVDRNKFILHLNQKVIKLHPSSRFIRNILFINFSLWMILTLTVL